jgi:hypothetical protein
MKNREDCRFDCPKCGKERYFPQKYNATKARRDNRVCFDCRGWIRRKPKETCERPGRKRNPNKFYFDSSLDDWIDSFAKSDDMTIRNDIWEKYLNEPFNKLAECVINRYGDRCAYAMETFGFKNLHDMTVDHCMNGLAQYDKSKGKSYSYFTVTMKNYIMALNMEIYSKQQTHFEIIDSDNDSERYHKTPDELIIHEDNNSVDLTKYLKLAGQWFLKNIHLVKSHSKNGTIVISAIAKLMMDEGFQCEGKIKDVNHQIRSLVGNLNMNSSLIQSIARKMIPHHKRMYKNYIETGKIE